MLVSMLIVPVAHLAKMSQAPYSVGYCSKSVVADCLRASML